jgi:hypothetical protein
MEPLRNQTKPMNTILLLIAAIIPHESYQLDQTHLFPIYVVRGGPRPETVADHKWFRHDIDEWKLWDGGPGHSWHLYRLANAPGLRRTDREPWGTWLPAEMDTPVHRARRGNGPENYEDYLEPTLASL